MYVLVSNKTASHNWLRIPALGQPVKYRTGPPSPFAVINDMVSFFKYQFPCKVSANIILLSINARMSLPLIIPLRIRAWWSLEFTITASTSLRRRRSSPFFYHYSVTRVCYIQISLWNRSSVFSIHCSHKPKPLLLLMIAFTSKDFDYRVGIHLAFECTYTEQVMVDCSE